METYEQSIGWCFLQFVDFFEYTSVYYGVGKTIDLGCVHTTILVSVIMLDL